MTFKKWIAKFADENSPRGDFARDVLADTEFPDTNKCGEDKQLSFLGRYVGS